jgi:hypothetical protein
VIRQRLKQIPLARDVNAFLRGYQQHWKALGTQASYELIAQVRGLQPPSGAALRSALRARVAKRRAGRPAKRLGEMHIFLTFPLSNWEAILPRALAPFGRVTTFEWRSAGFDDRKPDWLDHRDEMNREMLRAFEAANRESPVDAVVAYVSGANTSPETLQTMAAGGAVIFNFCLDDTLWFPEEKYGGRYLSPAAIAHVVDLNLTSAPASVVKYAVHGGLAMFHPEAAHPEVHRPYDVPFDLDVSFVGASYGWRPKFLQALAQRGVRVECFGRGWPNGPLSDEDMVRLYSRSRINLGFGAIGHSRNLLHLKGRDFEVPMSGGLYLTQFNPELHHVFELGHEILTFRGADDCAATIRGLLADPERAERIRRAGHARALRDHTYQTRWSKVFELAGLLEEEPT